MTEAMAAGIPVVGYASCPAVNELIVSGENGIPGRGWCGSAGGIAESAHAESGEKGIFWLEGKTGHGGLSSGMRMEFLGNVD